MYLWAVAQTTRLASFGPVLVVGVFLLSSRRVFCNLQPIHVFKYQLV
jgi:hypothetical protein